MRASLAIAGREVVLSGVNAISIARTMQSVISSVVVTFSTFTKCPTDISVHAGVLAIPTGPLDKSFESQGDSTVVVYANPKTLSKLVDSAST